MPPGTFPGRQTEFCQHHQQLNLNCSKTKISGLAKSNNSHFLLGGYSKLVLAKTISQVFHFIHSVIRNASFNSKFIHTQNKLTG
jgi:hypothetical protein